MADDAAVVARLQIELRQLEARYSEAQAENASLRESLAAADAREAATSEVLRVVAAGPADLSTNSSVLGRAFLNQAPEQGRPDVGQIRGGEYQIVIGVPVIHDDRVVGMLGVRRREAERFPGAIHPDQTKVRQALFNLLSNATSVYGQGSTLTVLLPTVVEAAP